jgi:hypothetical protein
MSLTQERLKSVIRYEPDSGGFFWIASGKKAGSTRKDGYIVVRIDKVLHFSHRLAWLYVYGCWPSHRTDHINGLKSDNRMSNLRDVSATVNAQNMRVLRKRTQSTYLGVQRNHSGWQAHITVDGDHYCLGTFKTPEEAHVKYMETKRALHPGCTV